MSPLVFFAQAVSAANAITGASPGAAAAPPPMPLWASVAMYVPLVALGYFLFIRPQSVQKKQIAEKLKGAKTGDKVVTSSGIHGVISNVKDATFIIKVADNVKLEIEKSHVDKVLKPSETIVEKA